MRIYKIADLLIDIDPKTEYTTNLLEPYLEESDKAADFSVRIVKADLEYEYNLVPGLTVGYYESIAIYRKICTKILEEYDGMFFHCSALAYENKAYIFTAPSGTGKSTHARMWREVFSDSVVMINDDKPIIRCIDGIFYVYGTPWNGKHGLSTNIRVPLSAICLLGRGDENKIERVDGFMCLANIMNQTIVPKDPAMLEKLFDISERLLGSVPVYNMECTISHDAAIMAYEAMKQ